jgi:putative transposase
MQQRKVTYRMYPSESQKILLSDMLGVHQRLYNKALEQRIAVYKETQCSISFYEQCCSLTEWRASDPKLEAVNAQSEQVTLKRLHLAFQAFFRRVKRGEAPGFPRFKAYQRFSGWGYKTHGDGWKLLSNKDMKHGRVRLSGVGNIPLRGKARTAGIPKTAEVFHKSDRWYLSVTLNCAPKRDSGNKAIGLDWGVENFATIVTSDNTIQIIENQRFGKKLAPKIRQCHKKISQSKKGSKNRLKLISLLGHYYRKLSNQRLDFIHKESSSIINKTRLIATEKLTIKNMTANGGNRKKGLNREILDTTPSAFFKLLKCKAEEAGIDWVEVPTRIVKPSQTCHRCGTTVKKPLSERWHRCLCGVNCSRDENAAQVMLNWALLGRPTGQELSEVWSGRSLTTLKHETHSVISA